MDFEDFMSRLDAARGGPETTVPTQEEADSFKPVDDLKPGDVLFQKGYGIYRYPGKRGACVVHRVLTEPYETEEHGRWFRNDFTVLMKEHGELSETVMDSRYFERLEEER
jgi:hypothetical protein